MFKENTSGGKQALLKYLSPVGAWALAFGCSVGWGSFVMPGTTFLPLAGPIGTAIGMCVGGLVMLLIGINYHFLMNRYPNSGGTYIFTRNEFGYDQGFMSAWFLILVYMAIVWANATAIPIICRNFFPGLLEIGPHYKVAGFDVYLAEAFIASLMIVIAGLICLFGGKWTARIQSVLAFVLIGGVIACAICITMVKGTSILEVTPAYYNEDTVHISIFQIVALAPWAYVGFESISHSTEEFSFSVSKTLGIFIGAIVAGIITYSVLALIAVSAVPEGCSSWVDYIDNLGNYSGTAGMPTLYAVKTYMGSKGVRILGLSVFAAVMTGLIGNLVAGSRLIYSLSRGELFEGYFGAVNKHHVPFRAIVCIMLISIPIPFFGRTAISWIVDVNTIGATIAYMYTSISAFRRAKKEYNKLVMATGIIGFVISLLFTLYFLIPNLWTVEALSSASYLILILWSILGFAIFYYILKRDKENRFGHSTVVWLVLLCLVFFITMLWFREVSNNASQEVLSELNEYNINQASKHGVELSEEELADARQFLAQKNSEVSDILLDNSILQMAIIMIALIIMLQVYRLMMDRERDMEVQKIKAEENSRAKSTFLSNMSHDIRTPMNAILGYTELTREIKDLPPEAAENLEKIDYSGKHLLSLINDILDMSRIESGKMELEEEPSDIQQLFKEVHTIFDSQMKSKNIEFTVNTDGVKDRFIMCDGNRLDRVLLNLISNAFKFTPEKGKVTVTLNQLGKDADMGRYEFRVKDTGIGMSPEFARTVFDAYTRERTASKIQGTGLGMAITKSIVGLMGGDIRVESEKGKGSEFIVNVSFKIIEEAEYTKHHKYENSFETLDYSKVKILLVDDVMINREIAIKILKKYGFMVDYAEDGQQAVDRIRESDAGTYQIVLMDIQMPIMNGYEATKAIRAIEDKDKANVPIIAMSANAFADDVQKSLDNGMNGHIAKPIEINKMMETINEILNG